MGCYPTTIEKGFLLWLFSITSNVAKMLRLKMGFPSVGVYYVSVSSYKDCYSTAIGKDYLIFFSGFTHHTGRDFCFLQVNVSRFMGSYSITIGKDVLLWLFAQSPSVRQKIPHLKWVSQV